jgi:hypothetical protein
MNEREPVEARLRALRPLAWNRVDHQRRLETQIMESKDVERAWLPGLAAAAGLVLAGGIAGATTVALIERWTVEEEDLPGDLKRVTITDNVTGESDVSTVPDDTAFFAIEGGPEGEALLGLTPLEGDPPQAPQPPPPPKD